MITYETLQRYYRIENGTRVTARTDPVPTPVLQVLERIAQAPQGCRRAWLASVAAGQPQPATAWGLADLTWLLQMRASQREEDWIDLALDRAATALVEAWRPLFQRALSNDSHKLDALLEAAQGYSRLTLSSFLRDLQDSPEQAIELLDEYEERYPEDLIFESTLSLEDDAELVDTRHKISTYAKQSPPSLLDGLRTALSPLFSRIVLTALREA